MKKNIFLFILLIISLVSFSQEVQTTRILLVGVSRYQYLSKDQQLNFADKDAMLLDDFYLKKQLRRHRKRVC